MNILLEFSSKKNIELLWEILLDELNIKSNNNLIKNIRNIFEANLKPFVSRANPNKTLINLNKDFLSQVIIVVNKLIPNLKEEQNIKKINISNEEIEVPYTINHVTPDTFLNVSETNESIQASRKLKFDRDLISKQNEFDKFINPPKPQEIDFSIKEKDTKITEMEQLISETISKRKYDIEEIKKQLNSDTRTNDTQKKVSWNDELTSYSDENTNKVLDKEDNDTINQKTIFSPSDQIVRDGYFSENMLVKGLNEIESNKSLTEIELKLINILNSELTNINKKLDILLQRL
jgi:hypothetical protein